MKRLVDLPKTQAHKEHACCICGKAIAFAEMHHGGRNRRAHVGCAKLAARIEAGAVTA